MGAGTGLGVVLHGEGGDVAAARPSTTPSFRFTWVTSSEEDGSSRDRVVVVLRGDLDLAGRQPLHRVVPTVVAEGKLVGARPERGGKELVAEADAEDRDRSVGEQAADLLDDARQSGRVAGAVGEEDPVGLPSEHLGRRGVRRHDREDGDVGQLPHHRLFDAEVVGDDPVGTAPADRGRRRTHTAHQVDTVGRSCRGGGFQR